MEIITEISTEVTAEVITEITTKILAEVINRTKLKPNYGSGNL